MEMCDRKYMFGDKSTFGSSQNGQKKAQKRSTIQNIFLYIKQGSITHSFKIKKFNILHSPKKSASVLRELGNETYTFYHLYTFKFKKAQALFKYDRI